MPAAADFQKLVENNQNYHAEKIRHSDGAQRRALTHGKRPYDRGGVADKGKNKSKLSLHFAAAAFPLRDEALAWIRQRRNDSQKQHQQNSLRGVCENVTAGGIEAQREQRNHNGRNGYYSEKLCDSIFGHLKSPCVKISNSILSS